MAYRVFIAIVLFFIPFILACSETPNLWAGLQPKDRAKSVDILLSEGELHYDRGQYDKALEKVRIAYERDKNNEKAAILLGFIHLAKGGMEPFGITARLTQQNENNSDSHADSQKSPLAGLESVLGFSADEFKVLTLPDNRLILASGEIIEGAPTSGIFVDYPVLLPLSAPNARRASTNVLNHLDQVIATICPFVSDEVKLLGTHGDARHAEENCRPSTNNLYQSTKAHFLWALAHLAEAIAFNAVVLYNPSGEGANLLRRADALKRLQAGNVAEYVNALTDLARIVDVVMPVDPASAKDSMLKAMFNDLEITGKTFDVMEQIPASVSGKLKDSLKKLNDQKSQLAAGTSGHHDSQALDAIVLKDSLTGKIAESIKEQINAKSEANELTPSELRDVCKAYESIAMDSLDPCKNN